MGTKLLVQPLLFHLHDNFFQPIPIEYCQIIGKGKNVRLVGTFVLFQLFGDLKHLFHDPACTEKTRLAPKIGAGAENAFVGASSGGGEQSRLLMP